MVVHGKENVKRMKKGMMEDTFEDSLLTKMSDGVVRILDGELLKHSNALIKRLDSMIVHRGLVACLDVYDSENDFSKVKLFNLETQLRRQIRLNCFDDSTGDIADEVLVLAKSFERMNKMLMRYHKHLSKR